MNMMEAQQKAAVNNANTLATLQGAMNMLKPLSVIIRLLFFYNLVSQATVIYAALL